MAKAIKIMQKNYHLIGTKDGQETKLTVFPAKSPGLNEDGKDKKDKDGNYIRNFTVVDAGNGSWSVGDKITTVHPAGNGEFPFVEKDGVRYTVALKEGEVARKPRQPKAKVAEA